MDSSFPEAGPRCLSFHRESRSVQPRGQARSGSRSSRQDSSMGLGWVAGPPGIRLRVNRKPRVGKRIRKPCQLISIQLSRVGGLSWVPSHVGMSRKHRSQQRTLSSNSSLSTPSCESWSFLLSLRPPHPRSPLAHPPAPPLKYTWDLATSHIYISFPPGSKPPSSLTCSVATASPGLPTYTLVSYGPSSIQQPEGPFKTDICSLSHLLKPSKGIQLQALTVACLSLLMWPPSATLTHVRQLSPSLMSHQTHQPLLLLDLAQHMPASGPLHFRFPQISQGLIPILLMQITLK